MSLHRATTFAGHPSLGRAIAAVALGVASVSLAPNAWAQSQAQQQNPTPVDQPNKTDWTDAQKSYHYESNTTTQTPATPSTQTPSTQMPAQPPIQTTQVPTSTTQTTASDYSETVVGAEREREFRPNRKLLVSGAAMLVAPYVAGVIVAAQSDLDADKRLYIPVVGPWLDLGQRPCSFGANCSTGDNIGSVLLIGSGVAQAAGVIMTIASFAVPERRSAAATAAKNQKPHVAITPVSYGAGGGIGATGTF